MLIPSVSSIIFLALELNNELVMGKKKKSFYKKQLKPLFKQNKVLLAALGGIATGITIASILGTEKAKEIVNSIENSVKDFTDKITHYMSGRDDPGGKKESKRPRILEESGA